MLEMIKYELLKIAEKKLILVGFIGIIILNYMMFSGWGVPAEMAFDGNQYVQGFEARTIDQEAAKRYGGVLTEEKINLMLKEYREIREKKGDYFRNSNYILDLVKNRFGDEKGERNEITLKEAQPTEKPLILADTYGLENTLFYMTNIILFGGFFLIIALSPVFSNEYVSGADALILTSKYGKKKCITAKILASFSFSLLFLLIVLGINLILAGVTFGLTGLEGSVQLSYMGISNYVPYQLNYGQLFLIVIGLWIAAYLFLTAIVLFCSAIVNTPFLSLIISAVVYTVPLFVNSKNLRHLVVLMPSRYEQIYEAINMELVKIGKIQFSYILIIVMVSVIGSFILQKFASKTFRNHQVVN